MENLKMNEEERSRILNLHESAIKNQHLSEQTESMNFFKTVQCFLSKVLGEELTIDGRTGPETKEAIKKYQISRKVYPVDGVWGTETSSKMSIEDKEMMEECASEYKTIFDKIIDFFK